MAPSSEWFRGIAGEDGRLPRQASGAGLPLITATYLAVIGGLLVGFGGFAWIGISVTLALLPLAILRGRDERIALLLIFSAAGVIAGSHPPPGHQRRPGRGHLTPIGLLVAAP